MTQLSEELVASKTRNVAPITGSAIDASWEETIWALLREVPGFLMLYDEAFAFQQIKTGHWQVWAYSDTVIRGIVITRVLIFPRCKVLDVVGMSGDSGVEFMDDLNAVFENLARQQDCAYITSSARPGMERILARKFEATKVYSTLYRPVGLSRSS